MASAFVGRQKERDALASMLDGVSAGRGALAVLVGEPGIGKSRLADEITSDALGRGFRTAWGRTWESGGAPAYFPWTQALATLGLPAPEASLATAVEEEVAAFQLFRAVSDALRAASAAAPILMVLDDLHVADVSSLRMLHFVARELRSMKVAIVATRRDVDAAMSSGAESMLAQIAREGRTFVLSRLERADVEQMVRAEGPRIRADLEPEIWRATQGNPLFVGEIVRLLDADPSAASGESVPIPYGAREIVRQRLARLDAPTNELLEAAAVLGVDFEQATLAACLAKTERDLAGAMGETVRAGLLQRPGDRRVRFGHALFRDVVYRGLAPERQASLHAAAADALERLATAPWIEIAHHAIEAGAVERLVERTSKAAHALSAAFANDDASRLLERSLAVLDGSGRETRDTAELLLLLCRTQNAIGDLQGGRASAARAADIARTLDDGALFARAALAHAVEITQGATDEATHRLLEDALRRVPDDARGLRERLRARFAASLQPAPDPLPVAREALDAVNAAREIGDDEVLLDVLHDAGGAFAEAVFVPEVVDMGRDAVRLAERFGDRIKLFRARLRLALALMEVGDFAAADAQIDALDADTRATGQPRHMWPVLYLRAMRAELEGRFDDGEALAEEAKELGGSDPTARTTAFLHRFARARALEQRAELVGVEPQIVSVVARWNDGQAYAALMTGIIRSLTGDLETARAQLARIPFDSTPARIRVAAAFLAGAAVRVGDERWARELYERLLPDAERWHVLGFGGFAIEGTYARYLGGFAALLGKYDAAERHFETALARAEAASAQPEIARIRAAYAAMLAARGRSGDGARAKEIAAPALAPISVEDLVVSRDGETWQVTLGAHAARLKDSRGLAYLARLVAEPNREIHALDLAGASEGVDAGDAGEALDEEARAAYKRRLAELEDELREAESWNDGARATRARTEMDFLLAELSRAIGLGGRERRVGASAERARVAVTRRVRETIRRIAQLSPEIGRYLEATVKTGTSCAYRPLTAS